MVRKYQYKFNLNGLSVPEKQKEVRYTQAEYEIAREAQKGNNPVPWKEQIH